MCTVEDRLARCALRGISPSRKRTDALPRRIRLASAALLLIAACDRADERSPPPSGEWLKFGGSWTATGTRHNLRLGTDRHAAIFDLSGSLLLTGAQRPAVGFKAQAIGFSDSSAGMQGRALWTDERGEEVYSDLKGETVGSGKRIVGTITGGTGRYAGARGEYGFEWQYVMEAEDGTVSGRTVGLEGRARLAPAPNSSSGTPPR